MPNQKDLLTWSEIFPFKIRNRLKLFLFSEVVILEDVESPVLVAVSKLLLLADENSRKVHLNSKAQAAAY